MKAYKVQRWPLKILVPVFSLMLTLSHQVIAVPFDGYWQARLVLALRKTPLETELLLFSLENILEIKLQLSGLQLDGRSVLNKIDPAIQIFRLSTTIGTLTLNQLIVFSRNIAEINENLQIKAIKPDTGQIIDQHLPLFYKDLLTPIVQLVSLFEPTLTEPLILRKMTLEAEIQISEWSLSILGLLANWGSAMVPHKEFGIVLALSVQTIAGWKMRSEIYIGTRRGFECFFTCSPDLRFYQGRIVPGFQPEYVRLWLSNIKLFGVILELDTAYNLNLKEEPCGISYLQIRHWLHLASWHLDITDILHFKCNLFPDFHTLITSWTAFNASMTALWTDLSGSMTLELQEFILVFSLKDWSLSSDIFFCSSIPWCFSGYPPVYKTDIIMSWTRDPWKAEILLVFLGFLRPFDKLSLTLAYAGKQWKWHIRTTLQISGWKAFELSLGWNF